MGYTEISDIRTMTNLEVADIGDDDIEKIISQSTSQLSQYINVLVVRERVEFIDQTRENKRDGQNNEYYVKNWEGKFLGDKNGDGNIDENDVEVYLVDSKGDESVATVTSVDYKKSKITLETAPSGSDLVYITYSWTYVDPVTPDPTLRLACTYLTAAFCFAKINIGMASEVRMGRRHIEIVRHMESFDHYYSRFEKILTKLNSRGISGNIKSKHSFD